MDSEATASPATRIVISFVRVGTLGLSETIYRIICTGPQIWYGWLAGHRSKFLTFEGYNASTTCGCRELQLTPRLKGSFPWIVEQQRSCEKLCDFKPPQTIDLDSACPVCRLIAGSVGHLHEPTLVPSLTRYRLSQGLTLNGSKADIWSFEADIEGARSIVPLGQDVHHLDRRPDGYLRPLQGKQACRDIMRAWISECSNNHPNCQARERQVLAFNPSPKRLINTKNMTVVLAAPHARYFALSYVWGGVTQPHVTGLGSLSTESDACSLTGVELPKVILDAIKLTKELGECYLWVDALCIDQDDLEDKAAEISRMNNVYLGALMTLVAMSGSDANSGLVGVDDYFFPRTSPIELIEGIHMSVARPSLAEAYSLSSWHRRAWCMQEHLFSRRLLFLGPEQIYFSCLSASYAEDRHEAQGGPYRLYDHPGKLLLEPPTGEMLWMSIVWKSFVELYSARDVSVETDRYPAFQGILNHQKETWGLHFVEASPLEFLPLALYWWHGPARGEPFDTTPRRIGNRPSWTWTGWSGSVCFPSYERYQSTLESINVWSDSRWMAYEYGKNGTLSHTSAEPAQSESPWSSEIASKSVQQYSNCLSFTAASVHVDAFDDGVRPSYLSLRDSQGHRIGGITRSTTTDRHINSTRCICILVGISWHPIGFFENIESFIGSTAEEKHYGSFHQDMLAPIDARYGQRFDEPPRYTRGVRFEIFPPSKDPLIKQRGWYAPIMFTTLYIMVPLLAVPFVTFEVGFSLAVLVLLGPLLIGAGLMYGLYLAVFRPLWIWSNRWRIAHVLWIEEAEGGMFKRNGVGEMKYSAFVKLKPETKRILLI